MSKNPKRKLIEMLTYMRPQGSLSQKAFCNRFIQPIMGKPDIDGNFVLVVGDNPNIAFMAHHDTVHNIDGIQKVYIKDDIVSSDQNCLGADCTTGVWLILEMIKAGINGVYIIHDAEESGCIGSSALVKSQPSWLSDIQFAISFDRKGYKSIITHQMGIRTASQAFADSLSDILGLDHVADNTGAYTDSNEYIFDVPECTNLSVGYFNQHTKNETQDLHFAMVLRERLIAANWSRLVVGKDVNSYYYERDNLSWMFNDNEELEKEKRLTIQDVMEDYGPEVESILEEMGFTAEGLLEEIRLMYGANLYRQLQ